MKKPVLLFMLYAIVLACYPQRSGSWQWVQGVVLDKSTEQPLPGAKVLWLQTDTLIGTATDENGKFRLQLPIGRQSIQVSYIGYKPQTIPELLLTVGKQVEIEVKLEESVSDIKEVVVTAETRKDKTINEYSTVSARTFSMEEVVRYSGGRNDVARLVANYAGVNTSNDARNDIVIRGNSPSGVLWRLEGVPIPNPNHFATSGTTGGPVSAMNTNLLKNSDFLTGAFAAEYGNANAGVFDLGFRSGNTSKHEFLLQLAAFSGLEAMAEGPLNKSNDASYLISYRFSFAGIAAKLNAPIGTKASPWYTDLSFKFDFGNNKRLGRVTFFGLGGYSWIDFIGKKLAEDDYFADRYTDQHPRSGFGVIGIKHSLPLSKRAYIRTVVSASSQLSYFDQYNYPDSINRRHEIEVRDFNHTLRISTFYNNKINARINFRTGILSETFVLRSRLDTRTQTPNWQALRNFSGLTNLFQPYFQLQYKPVEPLTFHAGLHVQYFLLNHSWSIEPRTAVSYQPHERHTISIAYGWHSQMQPLPVYFYREQIDSVTYDNSNLQLDFTRSHHIVLAYDVKIAANWRIKLEPYIQFITGAPVDPFPSSFSMLNAGADFTFPERGFLVNKGTGRNMGVELTIEKFFSKGYYGLITASIYDSRYRGSDGVWRNTAFNNQYVVNFLAGKEFKIGKRKQHAITTDTRLAFSNGRWTTPIDLAASQAAGREVKIETQAYSLQQPFYLRLDLKLGIRFNEKKGRFTQTFFVDLQNLNWRKNLLEQRYSPSSGQIYNVYQMSFFPDVMWRIQF